ncbi:MAG: hypothetical protein ACYSWP_14060 [Planctomycetota bacterium]|jgi:hypothetical protein
MLAFEMSNSPIVDITLRGFSNIEKLEFLRQVCYSIENEPHYGDLKEPLLEIAKMLKWKVVEET